MNTNTLKASRKFNARSLARAYGRRTAYLVITAHTERGYFSVTADAYSAAFGNRSPFVCGSLHKEAARFWPKIKPLIALHLCDATTGAPDHNACNAWYWLAGALGGAGEEYHGGNGNGGKTAPECLAIFADYLRITPAEAETIRAECAALIASKPYTPEAIGYAKHCQIARRHLDRYVDTLRPRWQAEAEAGIALLRTLATPATVAA